MKLKIKMALTYMRSVPCADTNELLLIDLDTAYIAGFEAGKDIVIKQLPFLCKDECDLETLQVSGDEDVGE